MGRDLESVAIELAKEIKKVCHLFYDDEGLMVIDRPTLSQCKSLCAKAEQILELSKED